MWTTPVAARLAMPPTCATSARSARPPRRPALGTATSIAHPKFSGSSTWSTATSVARGTLSAYRCSCQHCRASSGSVCQQVLPGRESRVLMPGCLPVSRSCNCGSPGKVWNAKSGKCECGPGYTGAACDKVRPANASAAVQSKPMHAVVGGSLKAGGVAECHRIAHLQCLPYHGAYPYFGSTYLGGTKFLDCMSCNIMATGVDCKSCMGCINNAGPCPAECKVMS